MSFLLIGKDWIDLAGLGVSILGVLVGAALTWQANRTASEGLS